MINIPLVDCNALELTFSTTFTRSDRRDVVGHVRMDFAILNRSQQAATGAYLDIPPVGIPVRPALDWQFAPPPARNFGAIRLRGSPGLQVEPGHMTPACYLMMAVKQSNGGSIRIGECEQPLAGAPDIRLFCTIGADNFGPVRACLKLKALDVRALLAIQFPHAEPADMKRQLRPAAWKLAIA